MQKQAGQSLIEVLIALTVTVIMMVALITFVLSGLKNAQFAQNQSKATKLAQETMEQIKTIRDRDGDKGVYFTYSTEANPAEKFSDLWKINMSMVGTCIKIDDSAGPCYFKLEGLPVKLAESKTIEAEKPEGPDGGVGGDVEGDVEAVFLMQDLGGGFKREITLEDTASEYDKEKKVTVRIFWTDSVGEHESNIQTYLTKI